jgi:hypothetical protein
VEQISKFEIFFNGIVAISLIPVFLFAYLGITSAIEREITREDEFYEFWNRKFEGKSEDEITYELIGTYSFKVIKRLADPEKKHYRLRRKILTSKSLDRLIAVTLTYLAIKTMGTLTLLNY